MAETEEVECYSKRNANNVAMDTFCHQSPVTTNTQREIANVKNERQIPLEILAETIKGFNGLTIQSTINNSAYYDSEEDDCNQQGKRGHYAHAHAHAHRHARTLPNPEALGPEIEEGAVNRGHFQALLLLPWGGARPATAPAPSSYRLQTTLEGCQTNSDLQERPPSRSAARLSVRK